MARDKLVEIAAVRARAQAGPWRGTFAIQALHGQWRHGQDALAPPAVFVVIRLVTALEVFTRDWVKEITDAGEAYIQRAADIVKGSLKIDFAVAQALVGKQVTFGDLVAHEIPVNSMGDIERVFTALMGSPLFVQLENVVDRYAVEIQGEPPVPLLGDSRHIRAQLAKLFELRHIHVHELPDAAEIDPTAVACFIEAAYCFCRSAEEAFATLLHGNYPLTQLELNCRAQKTAYDAKLALKAVLDRLDPDRSDLALTACQEAWDAYCVRQAEFRSHINTPTPGSRAPMIYFEEIEKITRARIEELEWYLSRKEGDL